ncbi:MAG: phage minor capsid protein [Ruminococcus sp.]|nr:phage minor capsid protein [Ruminococcus sp.]
MQITSGAFSYQEAIRQAVQKTAQDGVRVLYSSGHTDRIDVAVRRAVLTGVGQTCREIGLMNAQECGCDLMEITAHSGARPAHAQWQGKIVSLSGRKGYLSKSDIGYGTGDGFGGWNCRHDWFPFFEGYSKRNYSEKNLQKLDKKTLSTTEKCIISMKFHRFNAVTNVKSAPQNVNRLHLKSPLRKPMTLNFYRSCRTA